MRTDLYSLPSKFAKGAGSRASERKDLRLSGPALRITRTGRTSSLPLKPGTHIVGGGSQCDLVILGTASEPAFSLSLTERAGGVSASIRAMRDDVIAADRLLKRDETVTLRAGQSIRFDDTECLVDGMASRSVRPGRRKIVAAGLLVLAAVLLFAGFSSDDQSGTDVLSLKTTTPPEAQPTAEAIANELRQAIRLAQLPADMVVTSRDTEIRVGEDSQPLTFAGKAKLRDIIDALSRRSPVPIVDKSSLSSGLDGFIAAAGYAPVRFIVGADGHRYQEGDTISSGWQIAKISPGQITVSRNGETDTIVFSFPPGDLNLRLAKSTESEGNSP
jgi:hypothetical protein